MHIELFNISFESTQNKQQYGDKKLCCLYSYRLIVTCLRELEWGIGYQLYIDHPQTTILSRIYNISKRKNITDISI